MAERLPYSRPTVTALGEVTSLTQGRGGIYFDFPGATAGAGAPPAPGTPGTTS